MTSTDPSTGDDFDSLAERIRRHIDRRRLVETALAIMTEHSPTGSAGNAADRLAERLACDGFAVERPAANHPQAPAVVVRLAGRSPGPTLQFDGHLDTVHLPFVAPAVEGDRLTGTGACDMKGGLAAAVEALRALRDAGIVEAGAVLLTAHDLHEAPWGDGRQLDALIEAGIVGDAVLIPEPISDRIPTIGRGAATWRATFRRPGPPVHEVRRPLDAPGVLEAAAEFIRALSRWDETLRGRRHPVAGFESVFAGQMHGGEIYNQFPSLCFIEGTRRWLPGGTADEIEREFRGWAATASGGVELALEFRPIREPFVLDLDDPFVETFRTAYRVVAGIPLPFGSKPFVDDGNTFWARAGIPAITHGAVSGGQHTVEEWASIDDLVRLATVLALTAAMGTRA